MLVYLVCGRVFSVVRPFLGYAFLLFLILCREVHRI